MKQWIKKIYLRLMRIRIFRRLRYKDRSKDELHDYWRAPQGEVNQPSQYLERTLRSEQLVKRVQKYMSPPGEILEIGCNVGRNLHYLHQAGFGVSGIEISENAVREMHTAYPEMAQAATIHNTTVEAAIKTMADSQFDLVFTMAVLEHIHPDSEWIFSEMARVSRRWVITIEDEVMVSERHFPRNYGAIFQQLGMKQVEEDDCADWGFWGKGIRLRVFEHRQ